MHPLPAPFVVGMPDSGVELLPPMLGAHQLAFFVPAVLEPRLSADNLLKALFLHIICEAALVPVRNFAEAPGLSRSKLDRLLTRECTTTLPQSQNSRPPDRRCPPLAGHLSTGPSHRSSRSFDRPSPQHLPPRPRHAGERQQEKVTNSRSSQQEFLDGFRRETIC